MTIAVDWDIKPQTIQTKTKKESIYTEEPVHWHSLTRAFTAEHTQFKSDANAYLGNQKNHLNETILLSTKKMC